MIILNDVGKEKLIEKIFEQKMRFVIDRKANKMNAMVLNDKQYDSILFRTVQFSTVQYSTVQYSTVQYSTVQYSTVQYSTVQYSTVQ